MKSIDAVKSVRLFLSENYFIRIACIDTVLYTTANENQC